MIDDDEYSYEMYQRHMRKASNQLALCIARARAGKPTRSPSGLAWKSKPGRLVRGWQDCEIDQMRAMRDDGLTVGAIAEALGRTHESVKDGIRRHIRGFARNGALRAEPAE